MGARVAMWLQKFLVSLFNEPLKPTFIHCNNQICIKLSMNLIYHDRCKHIQIPYHYVRDMVERRAIKLEYINTSDQITDILPKPLLKVKVDHY